MREAVEDVTFMAEALETASRVDTKMVTGAVKRALINICKEKKMVRHFPHKLPRQNKKRDRFF